ncbi:MAG: hypothetical protein JNK42_02510 [Caedimonas sp.]|nr:hypothetical protein [Caedimonas sp.]
MAYSFDFRRKVLSVKVEEGLSFVKASERFRVGVSSIVRWEPLNAAVGMMFHRNTNHKTNNTIVIA